MATNKHGVHFDITAQDRASAVFKSVERSVGGLSGTYAKLTGVLAGVTAGVGLTAFLADAIRTRSALDDLADTTGDSVLTLDGLARQARVAGVDFDRLSDGLSKFARNLNSADDEGKAAGQAIEAIGLDLAQLRAMKPAEAMIAVAQALGKFEDGASKVAVAVALMGKEGAKMLPFLKDIAEDGATAGRITAEQAAQAEKLEKEWRRLKQTFIDGKDALADEMIPALSGMVSEMKEGIRIAGGFGNALLVLGTINPFKSMASNMASLRAEIEKLEKVQAAHSAQGNKGLVRSVEGTLSTARQRLEFLKFQEREAALAGGTGPQFLDARDLKSKQKPILDFKPEGKGKKDKEIGDIDSAYRNLLKTLKEKLLVEGELTEVAKLQLSLDALGARQRATIGPQREAELKALAARVDLNKREKDQMANNAKNFSELEEFREGVAKVYADIDKARGDAITAGYNEAEQIEFETRLIGMSNEQREKEIALRKLQLSGIRETDEAYAGLQKRLTDAITEKAIVEKNKKAADEITEFWRSAAENMQQSMSGLFFDVMQGNLSNLGSRFKTTLDRMVADVLAAKAATALFGKDFGKGGEIGGLVGQGISWWQGLGAGGGAMSSGAFGIGLGGYALGTDYVPRTGLYQLHQGEAVVPASENHGENRRRDGAVTIVNQTSGRIDKVVERRMSNDERVLFLKEAADVMAAQLGDPNSKPSRAMARNFSVQRSR